MFKKLCYNLKGTDLVVVSFFVYLTILNMIFHCRISEWSNLIFINFLVIGFVFTIAWLNKKYNNRILRIIHYWYLAPIVLLTFKELYFMVKPIRGKDYDYLFIEIDRWMFGVDPTVWLYQFSHPILTEFLQIVYATFYFLPIILAVSLWLKKRMNAAEYVLYSVVYGFYLSYIGYFLLPAIGPRFTLHHFELTNLEIPGLWLTEFLRESVNTGESIPLGTPNPADVVQRDVFPSGHTMMTLIVMYLSLKLKSNTKYFLLPTGTLLIFSTVYLRYHYVIDLIGGAVFMVFSLWSGFHIYNWWRRKRGLEEFSYEKD